MERIICAIFFVFSQEWTDRNLHPFLHKLLDVTAQVLVDFSSKCRVTLGGEWTPLVAQALLPVLFSYASAASPKVHALLYLREPTSQVPCSDILVQK